MRGGNKQERENYLNYIFKSFDLFFFAANVTLLESTEHTQRPAILSRNIHDDSWVLSAAGGLFYVHSHTTPQAGFPTYPWIRGMDVSVKDSRCKRMYIDGYTRYIELLDLAK